MKHRSSLVYATCIAGTGLLFAATPAEGRRCQRDAVLVGTVCVDKYEASVWETTDLATIKNIQKGQVQSVGDLAAATQHGAVTDDYGAGCLDSGNGCQDFYAVSVVGATPSAYLTWFQAAAACRNAGKRLLTNQEWQVAALGTPDPGTDNGTTDCNVSTGTVAATGSRSQCVSDTGVFDLVGNLTEWVGDWGDTATGCTSWSPTYGSDYSCVGGDGTMNLPGGRLRGGDYATGLGAGVFHIHGSHDVSANAHSGFGFRCAHQP